MEKCPNCGSEMDLAGNNEYYCSFCYENEEHEGYGEQNEEEDEEYDGDDP